MYTFMAKFEELNKSLEPLKSIAAEMLVSNTVTIIIAGTLNFDGLVLVIPYTIPKYCR